MAQRNYNMVKCPESIDADCDDWSTEHCPKHASDEVHDYNMNCGCCSRTGIYISLDDAVEHGWWTYEGYDYCPEHAYEAIEALLQVPRILMVI